MMEVTSERYEDILVVNPKGRLNGSNAAPFDRPVRDAMEETDLGELSLTNSARHRVVLTIRRPSADFVAS